MIDGVQFTYHSESKALTKLPIWEILINEKTGKRVNDLRNVNFRAMYLQLKPCANNNGFNLVANGSLHKWFNCGEHNNNDFSFISLYDTINSVTSALRIEPQQCYLHGLEIGLNITLPFSALRVIKNLVCYKGKPFTQINKRNAHKGLLCSLSEYDVKLYDKAAQNKKQGGKVLRFELHLHKMRVVKQYGINTLADLQNAAKVYQLKQLLFDVLAAIVWTDSTVKLSQLNNREQKQWLYLLNAKSWETISKLKAFRQRKKANDLVRKYGEITDLKPFTNSTWERLFFDVLEALKSDNLFTDQNEQMKHNEMITFSQLECCEKRLSQNNQKNTLEDYSFFNEKNTKNIKEKTVQKLHKNTDKNLPKKKCKCCGRDITHQRPQSVFCSERLYGKNAKQCRNKDSNRRRDLKTKIKKAMIKQNFIEVTYNTGNGSYTDMLHPAEIMLTRDWLNKIESIKIMPTKHGEQSNNLKGNDAKKYMEQFLTNNKK